MIDTMFCFFAGSKSASVAALIKTATAWFETSAGWPVKSAFLWYCHNN
jgi:hypothetical protein